LLSQFRVTISSFFLFIIGESQNTTTTTMDNFDNYPFATFYHTVRSVDPEYQSPYGVPPQAAPYFHDQGGAVGRGEGRGAGRADHSGGDRANGQYGKFAFEKNHPITSSRRSSPGNAAQNNFNAKDWQPDAEQNHHVISSRRSSPDNAVQKNFNTNHWQADVVNLNNIDPYLLVLSPTNLIQTFLVQRHEHNLELPKVVGKYLLVQIYVKSDNEKANNTNNTSEIQINFNLSKRSPTINPGKMPKAMGAVTETEDVAIRRPFEGRPTIDGLPCIRVGHVEPKVAEVLRDIVEKHPE